MKKLHKVLASALAGCMALSLMATSVSAAPTGTSSYTDVPATASYSAAIERLTDEGVMDGIGDGKFGPDSTVTRAQVITVLGRLAKANQTETDQFTDVKANSWYSGYVGWAVENGIVNGVGNGRFAPNSLVTSEHLNLMLSRYANLISKDITFYDTGASVVTRADLAQRLYQFYVEPEAPTTITVPGPTQIVYQDRVVNEAMSDSSTTLPIRAHVTSTGRAGCDPNETAAEHAAHSSDGWIMGYSDRGIYTFKGVQYATARRYENPKPANLYGRNGVTSLYNANQDTPTLAMVRGASSPQAKTNTVYSDYFGFAYFMTPAGEDMYGVEEECLNLNIWTSSMDSNAKKPVLVFMHGGGTDSDSATGLEVYEGRDMAEHTDVVFVTVNARLGNLGYSTDLTALGGGDNLATRDMLLSLEWVKENIATFGGDPNNVTVAGQSGGGSKLSYLIVSKYADEHDLFQKAVAISASLGSSVTTSKATREAAARTLADNMKNGYTNRRGQEIPAVDGFTAETTDAEVLAYLQSLRTDEVASVLSRYGYSGGSVVDGYIFDENSVFGTSAEISPRAAKYDYLIGNTWAEMVGDDSIQVIQSNQYNRAKAYMSQEDKDAYMESWRHQEATTDWYGNPIPEAYTRGTVAELKEAFAKVFPGKDPYDMCTLVGGNLGGFTRDNYYNSSMRVSAGQRANNSEHKTYEYLMAYEFPYFGGTPMYHTGDLAFWFYSLGNVRYQIAGDEENAYKVADFCSTALANFCRTGDPSTADVQWTPHEADNAHCMIVDVDSRLVDGDYGEELINLMEMVPVESN